MKVVAYPSKSLGFSFTLASGNRRGKERTVEEYVPRLAGTNDAIAQTESIFMTWMVMVDSTVARDLEREYVPTK